MPTALKIRTITSKDEVALSKLSSLNLNRPLETEPTYFHNSIKPNLPTTINVSESPTLLPKDTIDIDFTTGISRLKIMEQQFKNSLEKE